MQVFFKKNFICDKKLRKNDLLNCDKNLLNGVGEQKKNSYFCEFFFVVPTGFEPVTHGFSVRCSTN